MRTKGKNKNQRNSPDRSHGRPPLNAYYRGQPLSSETSSPFKPKAPKRQLRGYVFGFVDLALAIILVTALAYSLIVSPHPLVVVNDQTFHSLADYRTAAAAQLAHFNNRNKITLNENGLAAALKKQFPEIRAVQVELPLFSEQPKITLAIDGASFFLDSQGSRYIVDASGRAVAKSGNLPKVRNLPVINDSSGYRISPGAQVLSSSSIGFTKTVLAQCRQDNLKVVSLTLPPVPEELDLKVQNQPYFVKFYLRGDPLVETGQYLAAKHHFSQTGQPPSQYLDVRVAGKVFFK